MAPRHFKLHRRKTASPERRRSLKTSVCRSVYEQVLVGLELQGLPDRPISFRDTASHVRCNVPRPYYLLKFQNSYSVAPLGPPTCPCHSENGDYRCTSKSWPGCRTAPRRTIADSPETNQLPAMALTVSTIVASIQTPVITD